MLLALAAAAFAQGGVVKCIDVDGNVTYQDAPCTQGQAGRTVELPKAQSRDDSSRWEAAAREARVERGMPKRWVLRARGAPLEIRPAAPREEATEIWRYAGKEGVLLVGFAGPDVAWVRDEALPRQAAAAPASIPGTASAMGGTGTTGASGSNGAGGSTRGAQNRRFVIAGRYCEHVFVEIGPADRQEALPAVPAAAAATATATATAVPGTRHYYEPAAGDPQMRTVFSCIDGKVADVERTMVR
ncbi:MAG: DUF4124 domain-containing protein [Burkholderiales bacterium]|nr:DUF4124 domain-containing protein [Burkholderiales bacterium]